MLWDLHLPRGSNHHNHVTAISRSMPGSTNLRRSISTEAKRGASHHHDEPFDPLDRDICRGIAKEVDGLHNKMDRLLAQVGCFMETMADLGRGHNGAGGHGGGHGAHGGYGHGHSAAGGRGEGGGGREAPSSVVSSSACRPYPPQSSLARPGRSRIADSDTLSRISVVPSVVPLSSPEHSGRQMSANRAVSEDKEQRDSKKILRDSSIQRKPIRRNSTVSEGELARLQARVSLDNVPVILPSCLESRPCESSAGVTPVRTPHSPREPLAQSLDGFHAQAFPGEDSWMTPPPMKRSLSSGTNASIVSPRSNGDSLMERSLCTNGSAMRLPAKKGRAAVVITADELAMGTKQPDLSRSYSKPSQPSMSQAVAKMQSKQRRRSVIELKIWRFLEDPHRNRKSAYFAFCMDCIIFASIMLSLFDSIFDESLSRVAVTISELTVDGIFLTEIAVRLIVCPDRLRFFWQVLNLIDLAAGTTPLTLRVLAWSTDDRILKESLVCVVPLFRMLKLLRRFEQFHLLTQAFKIALEALPFLIFTLTLILFGFSACVFLVEPRSNIPDFGTSLWLALLTASTVGYGDIVPVTPAGKVAVSALVVMSVLYTSIPVGIVGGAFNQVWSDRDRLLLVQRTRSRLLEVGIAPEDFPALFRLFDSDGDGELSLDEFIELLKQLRVNMSKRRVMDLFRLFDKDDSGTIDSQEFVKVLFPSVSLALQSTSWSADLSTAAAAATAVSVNAGWIDPCPTRNSSGNQSITSSILTDRPSSPMQD